MKAKTNERKNALGHLGDDPQARARWLLKNLQDGTLPKPDEEFREGLQVFLAGASQDTAIELTKEFTEKWWHRVKRGFKSLQRSGHWTITTTSPERVTVQWKADNGKGKTLEIVRSKEAHRLFLNQSVYEAMTALAGQLRTCERCGLPFIRKRKQRFCDSQCNQRTRNERFKRSGTVVVR